jgi:hypothetical protein
MTLKSSVKKNHGLEKRVHEWSLKNSKMATLLAILWFIKLQSLIDSNTSLVSKIKVFYKTVVFSQNFKNALYQTGPKI